MWVVKLGGSLQGAQELRDWLSVLEGSAGCPVVLVPGGGRFADAVRGQQALLGFSDEAAHRMALLAMEQHAWLLAEHSRTLQPAAGWDEIHGALQRGRIPVWLPSRLVNADERLPASWDLSSDSLALWLARKLSARQLVLVKSVPPPAAGQSLESLAACGYVDRLFPQFAEDYAGAIACLSGRDHELFSAVLDGKALPDDRVIMDATQQSMMAGGEFG